MAYQQAGEISSRSVVPILLRQKQTQREKGPAQSQQISQHFYILASMWQSQNLGPNVLICTYEINKNILFLLLQRKTNIKSYTDHWTIQIPTQAVSKNYTSHSVPNLSILCQEVGSRDHPQSSRNHSWWLCLSKLITMWWWHKLLCFCSLHQPRLLGTILLPSPSLADSSTFKDGNSQPKGPLPGFQVSAQKLP